MIGLFALYAMWAVWSDANLHRSGQDVPFLTVCLSPGPIWDDIRAIRTLWSLQALDLGFLKQLPPPSPDAMQGVRSSCPGVRPSN